MADKWVAGAIVVVGALVLSTCNGDSVTGTKVAAGTAVVAGAVAGGVAAGGAAGGAASGIKRGTSKRVEDAISGRNRPKPQPSKPRPVPPATTTTRPVPTTTTTRPVAIIKDCVMTGVGVCVVKP